jgi:origin recognition complex subunit 2
MYEAQQQGGGGARGTRSNAAVAAATEVLDVAPPGGFTPAGARRSLSRYFSEIQAAATVGSAYNEGERRTRRSSFELELELRGGGAIGGRFPHRRKKVKTYALYSDSEDDEEEEEDLEEKLLRRQLALENHEKRKLLKSKNKKTTKLTTTAVGRKKARGRPRKTAGEVEADEEEAGMEEEEEEETTREEEEEAEEDYFQFWTEKNSTSNASFSSTLKAPVQELTELMMMRDETHYPGDNNNNNNGRGARSGGILGKGNHVEAEKQLRGEARSEYRRWIGELLAGFNLVFHGFGSKKRVLEKLATHRRLGLVRLGHVLVLNGYMPPKSIPLLSQLLTTLADSLGLQLSNTTQLEQARQLRHQLTQRHQQQQQQRHSVRVFIVIHNIDGPQLRGGDQQRVLGVLAETPNLHLVASVDHINASLLWDGELCGRFNFLWHDVTTFAPYLETKFDSEALRLGNMATSNTKGVVSVLLSLTQNARRIFQVLAAHQQSEPQSPGLTFGSWFDLCSERLYTTSTTTMKHHLTELRDHKIVLLRRDRGTGVEYLYIDLPPAALAHTLSEIKDQL